MVGSKDYFDCEQNHVKEMIKAYLIWKINAFDFTEARIARVRMGIHLLNY